MDDSQLNRILQRLQEGDRSALEELWQEVSAPLYTFLLRLCRDRERAEDCLQEFFVRLCTAPPASLPHRPRAYLYRTARNLAIDRMRREHPAVPLEEASVRAVCETDVLTGIELERALAALSSEDRALVTLHLNGGLLFREAAEVLDMPLGTVLWRYRRAIAQLRELLKGERI